MKTLFLGLLLTINAFAGLPGNSLYQLNSKWYDQDGKSIELKDLSGSPVILSLVYLSCQYICPTVISEVKALEEQLDAKIKDKTKVVLISFDPERDSPSIMKAYIQKRKLNEKHWMMISNKNQNEIRKLAAALNFKYQKNSDGDYSHSFMILVLNQNGEVSASVEGANKDKEPLIKALKQLLKI